jgi:hypothetical protein
MSAFVGRVDELGVLDEVGRAASAGEVAAAIVVGDAGCGKSRLLAEAADRSALARVFRIIGYEPERQVPLAAASDDLQWVDELSVALCHYLVRAAGATGEPLALVAAGRPSPNEASLSTSLGQVLPQERLARLELGPLPSDEAFELTKALAPALEDHEARTSPPWPAGRRSGSRHSYEAAEWRRHGASSPRVSVARAWDAGSLVALLAVAGRPLAIADAAALHAS